MAPLGALVAAGRTSDVYEFGAGVVVKVPRPQVPDHWAPREAEYTAAVQSLGVRAPAVIDVTRIDGRNAIVFERIEGRSMWEHMLATPARIPEYARTLADTHRRILAAGPQAGLDGLVDRTQRKLADVQQISAEERTRSLCPRPISPQGCGAAAR